KSYRESAGNNFFGSLASLRECESLIHLSLDYQKNITGELKDLPVDSLHKQLAEKDEELEIEREANIESAQAMDRFYRGQFIENKDPDNVIKNNFANDYLSLNQENQHLKKQNSELKSSSELVVKLFETNILVSELEEKTDRITVLENELQIAQEKITNYEKKLKKVLGESDLANWKNKVVKKSELDKVNAKLTSLQRQLEVLNTQKLELVTFTNNLEKEIDNLRQKETNLMIVNRNLQETEKSLKKCNNYHKAAEVGLAIIAGIALADCQSEDAGSIPVTRSKFGEYGEVVNALVCGTSIREFNSRYSPHY
ncbi:24157_t:CDS:2, partial [Racocetra persica]